MTQVVSTYGEVGAGGTSTATSRTETTAGGGFSTVSSASQSDGSTQESSFVADGQGIDQQLGEGPALWVAP